jgi:rhodanese-related sulfurtransferase
LITGKGLRVIEEIDSETLHRRFAEGERVRLLDIRTPGEVAQGVIPGSEHIPMHLIPLRLSELSRDQEVVLYCRSGARSYHACMYLMQQGYGRVVNLRGGIVAWMRHGFDIAPPAESGF